MAAPAWADGIRIATWNAELSRFGPGLLLRALTGDKDPQITAALSVIGAIDADVLLISGMDFDAGGQAVQALANRLGAAGHPYPHSLALRPNTGIATGLDLDGNGKRGEARDAQGYGRFAGQAGMALLSRLPILADQAQDYSGFLWADLPGNLMPPDTPPEVRALQRLSTSGHWAVPVELPDGRRLTLLAWYATPPVFDGPEDRNGRRNHDEAAFWLHLLSGRLPFAPPRPPFVVLGQPSLDPVDGQGLPAALVALLSSPLLQDPAPQAPGLRTDPGQKGNPALDTALYDEIGGLRVEVILPSAEQKVTGSGVIWPAKDDPLASVLATASHHRPVWVDVVP